MRLTGSANVRGRLNTARKETVAATEVPPGNLNATRAVPDQEVETIRLRPEISAESD